jgi:hypothetical protein
VDHRLVGITQLDRRRRGMDADVRRTERRPVVVAIVAQALRQLAGLAQEPQRLASVVLPGCGDRPDEGQTAAQNATSQGALWRYRGSA